VGELSTSDGVGAPPEPHTLVSWTGGSLLVRLNAERNPAGCGTPGDGDGGNVSVMLPTHLPDTDRNDTAKKGKVTGSFTVVE
jgi:hypothetical protein